MRGVEPPPGFRISVESRIAAANSIMETIREWASSGVLDPAQVSALALRVASRLVDSNWADDA